MSINNPNSIPVVGNIDFVDPDNAAQIQALMAPEFDLKAVVVTGRAAADPQETSTAELDDISPVESNFRTILNTVRMKNFMDAVRPGHDIPVFAGQPAPKTLVPHRIHIDELAFDDLMPGQLDELMRQYGGMADLGRLGLAGDIRDAANYLGQDSSVGDFSLIVGGPMTDARSLLRDPNVMERTTDIHAQYGMFDFGGQELMDLGTPRGKNQFNVYCDSDAGTEVETTFPKPIHHYPTDITRVDAIGFTDNHTLRDFLPENSGTNALGKLYDVAYEHMVKPRQGEIIYIHDIAPAIGSLSAKAAASERSIAAPYNERAVAITGVNGGEISIDLDASSAQRINAGPRYVATTVDPQKYLHAVHTLLG